MKELGANLKLIRQKKNWSQLEVSKILNINRVTYTGYESGEHDPSLEMIIKLANLYETSIDYLVGRYKQ